MPSQNKKHPVPSYQRVVRYSLWILFAYMGIGSFLDAVSNSSLIPPLATYFGTAIILSFIVTILFSPRILKRFSLQWVLPGENRVQLTGLKTKYICVLLAAVMILWTPRAVEFIKGEPGLPEAETQGFLLPASDPSPLNHCPDQMPNNALTVYLGNSVAYASRFPYPVIKLGGEEVLSINRSPSGLSITATIRSKDGRIVAGIRDNKFIINPNNYWYKERPDKHTLAVHDQTGQRALYVRFLNKSAIKILGTFTHPCGAFAVLGEESQQIGGRRLTRFCAGANLAGAINVNCG
jgi:hypothetical protein